MNTTRTRIEKRGRLDDEPNTNDARKLLDLMVGSLDDTLSSVGGEIEFIELDPAMVGDAWVCVRVPADVNVASTKGLGMYGVDEIEFYDQTGSDEDDVLTSTTLGLETEGPSYTFSIGLVETEPEGDN